MLDLLYNDQTTLERAIIACLLMKPELTDQLIIKPSDFTKHRGLLTFLQNFYKQFHNYDLTLMSVVAINKAQFASEITDIITYTLPIIANFVAYQERLTALQTGEAEEKKKIAHAISEARRLQAREISFAEFKNSINTL